MFITLINKERLKKWCEALAPSEIELVYGRNFIEFISHNEYDSKENLLRRIRQELGDDIHVPRFEFKPLGRKTLRAIAIRFSTVLNVKDSDMLYADFLTRQNIDDLNPDDEYYLYRIISYDTPFTNQYEE